MSRLLDNCYIVSDVQFPSLLCVAALLEDSEELITNQMLASTRIGVDYKNSACVETANSWR